MKTVKKVFFRITVKVTHLYTELHRGGTEALRECFSLCISVSSLCISV